MILIVNSIDRSIDEINDFSNHKVNTLLSHILIDLLDILPVLLITFPLGISDYLLANFDNPGPLFVSLEVPPNYCSVRKFISCDVDKRERTVSKTHNRHSVIQKYVRATTLSLL